MAETIKTELMKRMRKDFAGQPFAGAAELLICVSGGLDSMVLLDVCVRMQHIHRAPLRVLHVHHHTGEHADTACDLVAAYCRRFDLPLVVIHFSWDGEGNFEHEAALFRRRAQSDTRHPEGLILLAHHLQDQTETVLHQWVRGVGIATPLGMRSVHDGRHRPFLGQDRALLADHARRAAVPHILDPTNFQSGRFRTALRGEIMPALRQFHQAFESRIGHWVEDFQGIQGALFRDAAARLGRHLCDGVLARQAFAESPEYLWDFLLRAFWQHHQLETPAREAHQQLLAWLREGSCGVFDHGHNRIYCDLDGLALVAKGRQWVDGEMGQAVRWRGWQFALDLPPKTSLPYHTRDRFRVTRPKALDKNFKDYLRRERIPQRFRDAFPLISIDSDYTLTQLARLARQGQIQLTHLAGPPLWDIAMEFQSPKPERG